MNQIRTYVCGMSVVPTGLATRGLRAPSAYALG